MTTLWSSPNLKVVEAESEPEKTVLDLGPIKTWSASAWKQFAQCQHALYLRRAEKIQLPPDEERDKARNRGIKIHEDAEAYVRGERQKLPSTLKKFRTRFRNLRAAYEEGRVICEEDWIFDADWQPAEKFTPEAWLWVKLDAIEFDDKARKGALIVDYKSGKMDAAKHGMDAILYAVAAFMRFSSLQYIRVEYWYVDKGEALTKILTRNELPIFLPRLNERGVKLTTCKEFIPNPSANNCRYCDYRTNGCEYAIDEEAPMERYRAPKLNNRS